MDAHQALPRTSRAAHRSTFTVTPDSRSAAVRCCLRITDDPWERAISAALRNVSNSLTGHLHNLGLDHVQLGNRQCGEPLIDGFRVEPRLAAGEPGHTVAVVLQRLGA